MSDLPIMAALDEAEAITANLTDAVLFELSSAVGEGPIAASTILGDCNLPVRSDMSAADQVLNTVANRICAVLSSVHQVTSDGIDLMLRNVSTGLNGVLDEVASEAGAIVSNVASSIGSIVDEIANRLGAAVQTIARSLDDAIRDVGSFVGNIISGIERGIGDVIGFLSNSVSAIFQRVGDTFSALLGVAESVFDSLAGRVGAVVDAIVSVADATFAALSETLASVLAPLISEGESVLGKLGEFVSSVPAALGDVAAKLLEGLGTSVGQPLGALGSILTTQVEEFFGRMIEEKQLSHGQVLRTLLVRLGAPADVVQKIAVAADDAAPQTPAFFVAALAFLVPLVVAQFVTTALQPVAEQVQQEVAKQIRQSLLTPADLVDGFIKGDITPQRFQSDLEQQGYTQERIDLMVAVSRRPPDVGTALAGWLRGLVDEDTLDATLHANRLRAEDARLLKQVVFFIPPASDLIRMAVREVFSPDTRERFGMDEGFPEEFATFAAQQGISEEWARNYWAAHWALPSATQGFEMLHRRVIESDDLDMLLKALDVMPFWRDKLTQIAYSPLTRVDLRRMHALGLMTDDELQLKYQDLGYNEDDASMLVAFTIAYNAVENQLPDELVGLTRTSVLNMFEDGIIPREQAVKLLIDMGHGPDAAELYVDQRELDVERRDRRDLIESIVELAGGGHISLPESQDRLAQLGITATEAAKAIQRIAARITDPGKLPSEEKMAAMYKSGLMDADAYKDSLKQLGYSDEWVSRLFSLTSGPVSA